MKNLFKVHLLLVAIALSALILGSCGNHTEKKEEKVEANGPSNPKDSPASGNGQTTSAEGTTKGNQSGPTSIAGIIIDQTGKQIPTPGINVTATDHAGTGTTFTGTTALDPTSHSYLYDVILTNPTAPDNVQCANSTGNFFSSYTDNTSGAVKLFVVLKNSSAPAKPSLEIVFWGSALPTWPTAIPVTLKTQTAGAAVPAGTFTALQRATNTVTGIITPAMDLATFDGVTAGASYTISYRNAANTSTVTTPQFTLSPAMTGKSTFGITIQYPQ